MKMQVLMNLLEKKNDEVIYNFGNEPAVMDGIIYINIKDIDKSRVEKMPSDDSVYMNYANKAMAKAMRLILKGEIPEKIEYCS